MNKPADTTTASTVAAAGRLTIWGHDPMALHDRYWAAQGIRVVRPGEQAEWHADAGPFLLIGPDALVLFDLSSLARRRAGLDDVLMIRLRCVRDVGYREWAISDQSGRFSRFRRDYQGIQQAVRTVVLTSDMRVARFWSQLRPGTRPLQRIRDLLPRDRRTRVVLPGQSFDAGDSDQVSRFASELLVRWQNPADQVPDLRETASGVWCHTSVQIDDNHLVLGPLWIGAGHRLDGAGVAAGPAVLWDTDTSAPRVTAARTSTAYTQPQSNTRQPEQARGIVGRVIKRAFDVVFSAVVIILTLPMYPVVMAAIWWEDGLPFFFVHYRETLGGREFPCLKFRSMRRDAEQIKVRLSARNSADGPQFFIRDDPRLTRVGRFLRNSNIDELPQFWNVLLGHMSLVGPRPSPRRENQCCPAWREARLSVRPGIAGLWQVARTRAPGLDFQEWIRFDIEYLERQSLWLDLWILWRAVWMHVPIRDRCRRTQG